MWEKCSGLWYQLRFSEYGALEVGSGLPEIGGKGLATKNTSWGDRKYLKDWWCSPMVPAWVDGWITKMAPDRGGDSDAKLGCGGWI